MDVHVHKNSGTDNTAPATQEKTAPTCVNAKEKEQERPFYQPYIPHCLCLLCIYLLKYISHR